MQWRFIRLDFMFTTVSELDTDSDEFLSDEELDVNDHNHSATARRSARSRPHTVNMRSLALSKPVISFDNGTDAFEGLPSRKLFPLKLLS